MSAATNVDAGKTSCATSSVVYRGRFAPTPTGSLHFGSLVAAVGSYLQARHHEGYWQLRFDDLDQARNRPGASESILRSLQDYGFEWDGEVYYQLQHIEDYQFALDALLERGLSYRCQCSRKSLQRAMLEQNLRVYPGHCRHLQLEDPNTAIRMKVAAKQINFCDGLQGDFGQQLDTDVGDFIIRRSDRIIAYQLAIVVDDHTQKISEVVRGADLLDNTPRQIYLQQCLGYDTPTYVHLPLAFNNSGQKLSKQTHAKPIETTNISATLYKALTFLGQEPPAELQFEKPPEIWRWAIAHWKIENIPATHL